MYIEDIVDVMEAITHVAVTLVIVAATPIWIIPYLIWRCTRPVQRRWRRRPGCRS